MSNNRQRASKRAICTEPVTVLEGTSILKRARSGDALSGKHGESSIPVIGKSANEEINENVCCMCFVTFEEDIHEGTGAEWLPCPCGRWLHEDCAEDCIVDSDGNERYYSFCVDLLSFS